MVADPGLVADRDRPGTPVNYGARICRGNTRSAPGGHTVRAEGPDAAHPGASRGAHPGPHAARTPGPHAARAASGSYGARRERPAPSVVRGLDGAAEFGGAAPRGDHAALGPSLQALGPAQQAYPARMTPPLGLLDYAASPLVRELFHQIHDDHSVCASCADPAARPWLTARPYWC